MMTGRLYIDGKDIYAEYGVYVVQGGWNELIAYPPLKPVDVNDWQEVDGVEADLSSPVLDSKDNIRVNVAFTQFENGFMKLVEQLSNGSYHILDCVYIRRRYKLRLTAVQTLNRAIDLGEATLKFVDDFPLQDYNYAPPISNITGVEDYYVDGKNLAEYGVSVLNGTLDEVMRMPAVKTNLLRNISINSGALYDDKEVRYRSKNAKIYCLLRADTLDNLWRNYDALLFDLIRPGERVLKVGSREFSFYYKDSQVSRFYPDGKIWLEFVITVNIIRE